ncbi:hypothetical protein OU628_12520 [Escherichia coli]|nr:hypothetical protein [Escherichia coli]
MTVLVILCVVTALPTTDEKSAAGISLKSKEQPEIGSQERRRRIIAEKSKKRHIVAVNGLLHRKQNLRITAPDTATKREGKLFFSFFTDRP